MKIKTNTLIFKKYKVKKLIYQSKLSAVYEGINIINNEPVAIKFEKKNREDFLVSESFFLFDLKGFGIPKLFSFGKNILYNILVDELLGLSLHDLWDFKELDYVKIKNVCMIALQALDRLEYIHSKNVIHRDIKPNNFLIGRKNKEIIYLIDFGFAHKYRSSRTGKHIKYKYINKIIGSMLFNSINGAKGYEQSRKDDLESLGYMLLFLALDYLPWFHIFIKKTIDEYDKYKLITEMKSSITPEKLCNGLPEEFACFINYCRNLEFEQDPNYDYLKSLFTSVLSRNYKKYELFFFWAINQDINRIETKSTEKSRSKRKASSQKRLYDKIKKSIEKNKINNIKNTNDNNLILVHRDTIEIKCLDENIKKNEITTKAQIKSQNLTDNKKNNLIKPKYIDKANNKQKFNSTRDANRNSINNQNNKGNNTQFSINKKYNYNIILGNGIDFSDFNFIKINDTNSYKKKISHISNSSMINRTPYKTHNTIRENNNINKKIVINNYNTGPFSGNSHSQVYRTFEERKKINPKFSNKIIIKILENAMPKKPNFNKESLFRIKNNNDLSLYNANTYYDKRAGNKKNEGNSFPISNKYSEYMHFKNTLKNSPGLDIDSFDYRLSNL